MATVEQLKAWLHEAKPGDTRCYHLGFLAVDRERHMVMSGGDFKSQPVEPIDSIGRLMWDAYERGQVLLTQQRLGEWEYRYLATRR